MAHRLSMSPLPHCGPFRIHSNAKRVSPIDTHITIDQNAPCVIIKISVITDLLYTYTLNLYMNIIVVSHTSKQQPNLGLIPFIFTLQLYYICENESNLLCIVGGSSHNPPGR